MKNSPDANQLIEKYLNGNCSAEEKILVESHFNDFLKHTAQPVSEDELTETDDLMRSAINAHIDGDVFETKAGNSLWKRMAIAACLLMAVSFGYLFLKDQSHKKPISAIAEIIKPGSNKATLTLANGQKIILIQGLNGKLAQQGTTLIQVNGGKAIAYTGGTAKTTEVEFNTLSTKKGEQSPYPLVLADGTRVWLNAASSITFPTAFTGNERRVTVTGEAYFEVTHNKAQPFRVVTAGQTIDDLGTRFNINAYNDEVTVKTTLLEGAVKISAGKSSEEVYLKPGQESKLDNGHLKIATADTEGAIAWKNGMFHFANADLPGLMRQFARWYDVDISYQVNRVDDEFTGDIPRNISLQQALKIIQLSGVQFKIDGRKMTITQ